jgi:Ni,Fe-hydrogenase maturation factor
MAMEHLLVVGYGNPLRSDDGIAWHAAEQVRQELPDAARVICVHQLTPELAEDVAAADVVIFLDASGRGEPGSVRCEVVFTRLEEVRFSHHLTFLISIHADCFHHGQELSPAAIQAIPNVVAQVRALMCT